MNSTACLFTFKDSHSKQGDFSEMIDVWHERYALRGSRNDEQLGWAFDGKSERFVRVLHVSAAAHRL